MNTKIILAVATTITLASAIAINTLKNKTDSVNSAALCYITNQFDDDMQVEIIESKQTSGTYFIQPKNKAIFFCGDRVKVTSGKYKTELTLTGSTIFQQAKPIEKTKTI
jgi:hypothetical protein